MIDGNGRNDGKHIVKSKARNGAKNRPRGQAKSWARGEARDTVKNDAKKAQPAPISKDQARELGRTFLDVAHALGTYRFESWNDMTAADRKKVEDEEWDLLTYSSRLTTKAVGVVLDDLQGDLATIAAGAAQATKVIGTIQNVKAILTLAAAFGALGGAIASGNAVAIASAASAAAAAALTAVTLKSAKGEGQA
jgi:hypothetical protein